MTLPELYEAALRELRIVAAGESVPVEYTNIVEAKYLALYDMLLGDQLAAWGASEDVPAYAEEPVTIMLAFLCCRSFGINQARTAELEQAGALHLDPRKGGPSLAERQLRRQLAKSYVPYSAVSEYF